MLALITMMVLILLVAGVVVGYVAYPHRGRELPAAPWLGDVLRRGVDRLPTVAEEERDTAPGAAGQDGRGRRAHPAGSARADLPGFAGAADGPADRVPAQRRAPVRGADRSRG